MHSYQLDPCDLFLFDAAPPWQRYASIKKSLAILNYSIEGISILLRSNIIILPINADENCQLKFLVQ